MSNETFSSPQYFLDPQSQTHFYLKFKESLSSLIQRLQSECNLQPTSSNFTAGYTRFFCTRDDLDASWFANHANPMLQVGIDTKNGLITEAWNCMQWLISENHPHLRGCKPTTSAENTTNKILYIVASIIFALCIAACITCIWCLRRETSSSAGYSISNAESNRGRNSNPIPSESTKLLERKSAEPSDTDSMKSVHAHL